MANREDVFLRGKCKWAKVYRPNQYGKWSIDVYLNADEQQKFKDLKVKNHMKKDDDGYYVTISRPVEKTFKGKVTGLTPPVVLDKNNHPMVDTPIGNGSDVIVKIEHYSYKPPLKTEREYAIRLEGVKVMELVEYSDVDRSPEEKELVDSFKQPVHHGW